MNGPIFISHSSLDKDGANSLAVALRQAFGQRIRTFNTSSGTAIQAGEKWRQVVLEAIRDSSMVILWCTPAAACSKEVAFEIGAAFAFDKKIIPCAVHIEPSSLPWSLSEFQAPVLDTPKGWIQMAESVANVLGFGASIDKAPLLDLAEKFAAPSDALEVRAVGRTIEFKNTSSAPLFNVQIIPPKGTQLEWAVAIDSQSLQVGQSKTVLRNQQAGEQQFDVSWVDVGGIMHTRKIPIGSAGK